MKYKVTIQRTYDSEFYVEAENEEEAEQRANEQFDNLDIKGFEMYGEGSDIEEE